MICIHCGKQGHKEEVCPARQQEEAASEQQAGQNHTKQQRLEKVNTHGNWMLVKKSIRRKTTLTVDANGIRIGDRNDNEVNVTEAAAGRGNTEH